MLFIALLALACTREEPRRAVTIGEHRVALRVPAEWQPLDRGSQFVLREGEDSLTFTDLGAVRPEAFRRDIEHARELWRRGRLDEALTSVRSVPVRPHSFVDLAAYERFREVWEPVAASPRGMPYSAVAPGFDAIDAAAKAIEPSPLARIAEDALERSGHEPWRREVKSRRETAVGGREAMLFETWMTLTHNDPRRVLVIVNDGRALTLRCDRCEGEMAAAFDAVVKSLQFAAEPRT
jgi:hypothetical protein